jgi:hypothetical protein
MWEDSLGVIEGSLVDMKDVSVKLNSATASSLRQWVPSSSYEQHSDGLSVVGVLPLQLDHRHRGMYIIGYLNGLADALGASFLVVKPDDIAAMFGGIRISSDYLWTIEAIRGYPNLRNEAISDIRKAKTIVLGRFLVRTYATDDVVRARILFPPEA